MPRDTGFTPGLTRTRATNAGDKTVPHASPLLVPSSGAAGHRDFVAQSRLRTHATETLRGEEPLLVAGGWRGGGAGRRTLMTSSANTSLQAA
jgi:hypothetical protein